MNRELYGKLVFELSRPGRRGYRLPDNHIGEVHTEGGQQPPVIADALLRQQPLRLPQCDELCRYRVLPPGFVHNEI